MKTLQSALLLVTLVFFQVSTIVLASYEYPSDDVEVSSDNRRLSAVDRSLESLGIAKSAVNPKLGAELTKIYEAYTRSNNNGGLGPSNPGKTEYIAVDVSFTNVIDNESAKEALSPAVPVDFINCFARMCSVRIPVSALKDISNIDAVLKLKTVKAATDVGSVTTEGDRAMFADVARSKYSVNGSGLLIGVMSDSYNCLGGALNDTLSGDLPNGSNSIVIVGDLNATECSSYEGGDEGRGMMQLIHDVAPGARLAFRTAYRGEADFAAGILELAEAGCDVIVDDIFYYGAPMFQDGVVAQAVDQVVSRGVIYFSSGGNRGRNSWVSPTGFNPVFINNKTYHKFGTASDGSPIISMRVSMRGNSRLRTFILQWDEPFASVSGTPGSRSDVDFFLHIGSNITVSNDKNTGGDPIEGLQFYPSDYSSNATVDGEFRMELVSGPPPTYLKILGFGQVTSFEFPTNSSTNFGHSNSALGGGVGAAFYNETPAYGVSPPLNGSRLSSPEIRNRPRFCGPDGGATSFFGFEEDKVFRFYGTSAAAPHVAAVAALMLQLKGGKRSLTPVELYSKLAMTAIDMDDPLTAGFDVGFDFRTGAGFVNATAALDALVPPAPVSAPLAPKPVSVPTAPIPVPSPVAPTLKPCGLFGWRVFCPFTFCGIFGRLLGLCHY